MIVWGDDDRIIAPVYAQEFAKKIAGARVEMIARAGHLPQLEQPDAVTQGVVGISRLIRVLRIEIPRAAPPIGALDPYRGALTNACRKRRLHASAVERNSREGRQDMATTTIASAAVGPPLTSSERWTSYSALVLAICILGWAFDIYEATIMQLVTPILIKEWGITPAIMGTVTTISRWIGLIGTFLFPVLADLYGRRPALIWSILVYAVFTGLTGFSTGWVTLSDLELDHPHRRSPARTRSAC